MNSNSNEVNEALAELVKAGANIKKTGENSFLVTDNGFHGFLNPEPPFVIDADDLLEMHEMYCK